MQETQARGRGLSAEPSRQMSSNVSTWSPVDERTYNVLQALTSTLESIESYEMYLDQDDGGVFEELLAGERRHAERLLAVLRSCLQA
jgi:hypothetical protein